MTALERAIAKPHPVHDFAARSPLHGLERRSVGFADVVAQSVAAVAPTAAALTVILMMSGIAGNGTLIAVAVATVLALLVATTMNQFARRLAASGSVYTYTARGLGPTAALAAGAAITIGYGGISVFALLGGANALSMLVTRIVPAGGGRGLTLLLLIGETLVLAVVLLRGIRLSSRVALIVEAVSVALIAGLLVALIVRIGPVDPAAVLPVEGGTSVAGIAAGAVLALTAFVGFETSATLGVEARRPLRSIPRAMVWTVLVAGSLYLLAAYTQLAGFAGLGADLATSQAPIDDLAGAFGLGGWAIAADLGVAASFLACAIATTTALTRVLFAMARDQVVPASLGRVHPRFRTPVGAVAASVPVVALIPLALIAAGVAAWPAMQTVIVVAAVGYIVAYAIVCTAAPVFLRRIGEHTVRASVIALSAAAALAAGLAVYLVVEAGRGNVGVWAVGAVLAAATVAIVWLRRHRADGLARVGGYDEPVASQVLGGIARPSRAGDDAPHA